MAAPARRETTDEAFLREQYGEVDTYTKPVNRNGFGVQNAQIERRQITATPSTNQNRPPLRVAASQPQSTERSSRYTERQSNAPTTKHQVERPTTVPRVARTKKKKGVISTAKEVVLTGFAYARAVPIVISALAWTTYAYAVQLIFAAIALLFLGLAYYVEGSINLYEDDLITSILPNVILDAGSSAIEFFMIIYMIATIFVIVMILTMIAISAVQLKIGALHPLFGKRGKTMKLSFFLLALIGMFIPGVNLLPLVQFWLVAVMLNPR